jgi:hypothetical protein
MDALGAIVGNVRVVFVVVIIATITCVVIIGAMG